MINPLLLDKPDSFETFMGDRPIEGMTVSTDTRTLKNENTFICLYGENFDAHQMIDKIKSFPTIKYIIVEKSRFSQIEKKEITFIVVENIFTYLKELAQFCINDWNRNNDKTIIGLTGSAGKTSTKESLFHILSNVFPEKVLATNGNYNNHIGVPLTIFRINSEHDTAIIEMGTNSPGDIEFLAKMAAPNSGLIVNIGEAHLEKLINLEGVFKEKSALYHVVTNVTKGKGPFVIPSDDPYLNQLANEPGIVTFGSDGLYRLMLENDCIDLKKGDKHWRFENPIIEKHLKRNLIQAFVLALELFPDKESEITKATASYIPDQKNRCELKTIGPHKVYLDAYNANPTSMKASLEAFCELLKKENISYEDALLIIGDMKELGEREKIYHSELGEFVKSLGFKNLIFVGQFGNDFKKTFPEAEVFNNSEELHPQFIEKSSGYSHLFLKASRSIALEKLFS